MHSSFISSYSLIFSLFRVPRLSLIISPKSSILRLLNSEYIAKEFLTLAGDILKLVNSVNAVLLAFFLLVELFPYTTYKLNDLFFLIISQVKVRLFADHTS
jgi:hypothetical protein